ncbi:9347_t:CDS:2 [Acaulospora morrowiae]|uniref:9347_t:CDS:1 n=1 Tax=Acaulospora morrowiae TaxID=94023 RepID=A0A9N9EV15_9GLOM|nr:9347_t:CDS:2 [Acaulospora morrowiae]
MASTSNVKKSPNQQRNSLNTNYNDQQHQPRQILPSRQSCQINSRAYSQVLQPHIIVPTQFGYGDIMTSNLTLSKEASMPLQFFQDYDNCQAGLFGHAQHYPTTYFQQVQLSQPHSRTPPVDPISIGLFCDDCARYASVGNESYLLQIICKQCKDKYLNVKNHCRNSNTITVPSTPRGGAPILHAATTSQTIPQHTMVTQAISISNMQSNHPVSPVVPTQSMPMSLDLPHTLSSDIVQYSIPPHSANSPSDLSIDFPIDQPSSICYDNNPLVHRPSTRVLNDVFFSDQMIDDSMDQSLYFDSDASSDTDISTPNSHHSPQMSPTEIFGCDDLIWSLISDNFDESKDLAPQSSSTDASSPNATSSLSVTQSSSNTSQKAPSNPIVVSQQEVVVAPPFSLPPSVPVIPSNSNNSGTIDPSLISNVAVVTNHFSINNCEAIDPRFITSTESPSRRPPQVITRPNFIELSSDNLLSPPLQTPELVSDNNLKRRLSYTFSSDDDETSEGENKKIRVDGQKSVKTNTRNHDSMIVDEKEECEPEGYSSPGYDPLIDDNSTEEGNDSVTDEYHDSSDAIYTTDEDDDEYRPSTSSKKSRSSKKGSIKSQSKHRGSLSKVIILGKGLTKSKLTTQSKNKSKATASKRGKHSKSNSSSKRASKASTPADSFTESPAPTTAVMTTDEPQEVEVTSPRPTQTPTIFETLTRSGIDWCRYCGTTEGVNWRPGPWGKRTLCNKHGCDYKGYGFACKLPRLDLTSFVDETVEERERPVLQLFCTVCQKQESYVGNVLVRCEGCPKAFHQKCFTTGIDDETVNGVEPWYCEKGCQDNLRRKRIVVELPRKRLPLMSTPKAHASTSITDPSLISNSGTTSRPRTSRNSSRV